LKILIVIPSLLHFVSVFGQKLPQKIGAIEVKKINHHFLKNEDYELTKKTTNKQNRPYTDKEKRPITTCGLPQGWLPNIFSSSVADQLQS